MESAVSKSNKNSMLDGAKTPIPNWSEQKRTMNAQLKQNILVMLVTTYIMGLMAGFAAGFIVWRKPHVVKTGPGTAYGCPGVPEVRR